MSSRAKKQWKSIDQIVWVISSAAKRRQRCHYKSNRYGKYPVIAANACFVDTIHHRDTHHEDTPHEATPHEDDPD
jgi:hypothetical protein